MGTPLGFSVKTERKIEILLSGSQIMAIALDILLSFEAMVPCRNYFAISEKTQIIPSVVICLYIQAKIIFRWKQQDKSRSNCKRSLELRAICCRMIV
jgi:hypothetical protein